MDIQINGVTLQCDFMDADFMEPYEQATIEMQAAAARQKNQHYDSAAKAMIAQCDVVNDYFDGIFGEGTAAKVFGGSHNLMTHLQAVSDLTDYAMKAKKEINDFTNKYTQRQQAAVQQQRANSRQFVSNKMGGRH
jgi:hypothetical protein